MTNRRDALALLLWSVLPLLVPILCLCSCLRLEMNSPRLYQGGYERYSISTATGLSEKQLGDISVRLIRYFNSLEQSPQMQVTTSAGLTFDLFHDYEIIHLEDVKRLFALNSHLQALSLLLLVILSAAGLAFGRRRTLAAALERGAAITLCLLLVTAALFVADFDWMFVGFHLVAFDNSFWQLNPQTDFLVALFPWGFWQDMSLLAGVATGLAAAGFGLLARTLQQRTSNT